MASPERSVRVTSEGCGDVPHTVFTKRFDTPLDLKVTSLASDVATVDGFAYPYKFYATSTKAVDDVYCLYGRGGSETAGGRWINTSPYLNAYEYGATGNGTTDDSAAIQKMLNQPGEITLFFPPGYYKAPQALTRINKGTVKIMGMSSQSTVLSFSGNSDGLVIENYINSPNVGTVHLYHIQVDSSGTKTGTKEAVRLTTQHEYKPGIIIDDLVIRSMNTGQEWGTGLHIHDCSATSTFNLDIQSKTLTVLTGVLITNTVNRPCVEHNFSHISIRAAKIGFRSYCTGAPGNEGIRISASNFVAVEQGIVAIAEGYGAPDIALVSVHINSFGGECLYIKNHNQLSFINCLFYCNKSEAGVIPLRAIAFDTNNFVTGKITCFVTDNTPNAVEFIGSGGAVEFEVAGAVSSAQTNMVKVPVGYPHVLLSVGRTWNGDTTWGTTQGKPVLDLSGTAKHKFFVSSDSLNPLDKSHLEYQENIGSYVAVSPSKAKALAVLGVSASATLDMSRTDAYLITNGAANIVLSVDITKLTVGQLLFFSRYDETSTGTVTIQTSNPTTNYIRGQDGVFVNSYNLPTTTGSRQVVFMWFGSHLFFHSA